MYSLIFSAETFKNFATALFVISLGSNSCINNSNLCKDFVICFNISTFAHKKSLISYI